MKFDKERFEIGCRTEKKMSLIELELSPGNT